MDFMAGRIMTFTLSDDMQAEIDRTVKVFNETTDSATSRSGYIRLAIADRLRRDTERLKGYASVNAESATSNLN